MNDEKKNRLKNRWSVFRENHSIGFVLLAVIVFNIIFIGLSALLISFLPENDDRSVFELIKLAFTLMVNPSGRYVYSDATLSLYLTTIVVLLGMISLTGGTVGLITSFIQNILQRSANSESVLKMKDHIVVLNYNNKVPSMIVDYCFDDMDSTYVVILSNSDKRQVLDDIGNMYKSKGSTKKFKNIIVRNGDPMSEIDLDKINIKDAQTVLVMTPKELTEDSKIHDKDFYLSKLFMFINWYLQTAKKKNSQEVPNLVVETSNGNMEQLVETYNIDEECTDSVFVNYNQIMGYLIAITSVMPSLYGVLQQLFSFEGVELYISEPEEGKDVEYDLMYNQSVIPLYDMDDKRIYVAEDEDEIGRRTKDIDSVKKIIEQYQNPEKIIVPNCTFEKQEIIIVGINEKLPYILDNLIGFKQKYENEGLHVILASTADEEDTLKSYYEDEHYAPILMPDKFSYIRVNDIFNPMPELGEATKEKAETIVFLSEDNVADECTDAKPLIYWTDLRAAFRQNDKVDVMVEILDSANKNIIQAKNKDQTLVSDDFLGHLYAQLGKNPQRLAVLIDMITAVGDDDEDADPNAEAEPDAGDFLCLKVGTLLGAKEKMEFKSKRELIMSIYWMTGGLVLPLGLIKQFGDDEQALAYIFARTNGGKDGLDNANLLNMTDDDNKNDSEVIEVYPEDELVFFLKTPEE
ncbi:MAG: hypothetical protein MJ104_08510 [Lachnospiraceae bacterium]|nr:hypothetical protein [Lachnospiraceae bacterium]